jgi:hypothetical protein
MNLSKYTKVTRALNGVVAGTSNQNGSVIDMSGFEGVQFVALFGALTATQVTSLKVQQGNLADGSDMADLEGSLHTALADTDGNKCLVTDVFRPQKRYVRAVVTRGTANAVIDGVIALQYSARVQPVTNDTTVKAAKLLISPDEGTA